MIRSRRLAVLILAGCSGPVAKPDAYARARRVVADAARGAVRRDCEAAPTGLAEARRRDRRTACAETFGDPRP